MHRGWATQRLRNLPDLVAFNADKRYLGELSARSVPTTYVATGDDLPDLAGEFVVKPNISAGARNTGRFGSGDEEQARALIERIHASGKVALVQPYMANVDEQGETALVFFGGELSHTLSKRPVLREPGVAPIAAGELEVAAVMLEEDLVLAGSADAAQEALAEQVLAEIAAQFGMPLYARVDLVSAADGEPVLMELELIEPAFYLEAAPGSSERLAAAVRSS